VTSPQPSQDAKPSTVSAAVEALAAKIGEDPASIELIDSPWEQYLQDAVIGRVSVKRTRFSVALSHAVLGIEPRDEAGRRAWRLLVKLGSRLLMPEDVLKRFDRCESMARDALNNASFPTFLGRLIPFTRYLELKAEMQRLEEWYYELRDDLDANWDTYLSQVATQYRVLGYETYSNILAAGGRLPNGEQLPDDREAWVADFVRRVMLQVPRKDAALASYQFEFKVGFAALPSQVAEDQLRANTMRAEALAVQLEAQQIADARTQMRRDAMAQMENSRAQQVNQLMADVQGYLRGMLWNMSLNVLSAVSRNDGKLPPSNYKEMRTVLDTVSSMKFWDDAELDRQMQNVRLILDSRMASTNPETLTKAFEKIGAETRLKLLELDRVPQRSGTELGIPDDEDGLKDLIRQRTEVRQVRFAVDLASQSSSTDGVVLPPLQRRALEPVSTTAAD
jgi:hypothetical protein